MGSLYSYRTVLLLVTALIASIVLIGCEDDPPPYIDFVEYGLTVLDMDSVWVLNSDQKHRIKVQVSPSDLPLGTRMRCQISNAATFYLYDDGGTDYHNDSVGFADTSSGDADANDGIFTRSVSSRFTVNEGEYIFTFSLPDSLNTDTAKVTVAVRQNSQPVVLSSEMPDSIHSGDRDLLFSATIVDPDGLSDIESAEVHLLTERISFPMTQQNDSVWQWYSEPFISKGLSSGTYKMIVQAFDHLGTSSMQGWGLDDLDSCWLENLPPRIRSIQGPDTVYIPTSGETTFHYVIGAIDDQTEADLDSLLLTMRDQTGSIIFTASYFDDGEGIDSTAGDGRYYAGFMLNSNNQPDNYSFEWVPTDQADQHGPPFSTGIVILRRDEMPGSSAPDREGKSVQSARSNYHLIK